MKKRIDEKSTAVDSGQDIATADYNLGIWVGYTEVADLLMKEAGELFTRNQDKEAQLYRGASQKMSELATKKRQQYEVEYQPLREQGFARLEEIDTEVLVLQKAAIK